MIGWWFAEAGRYDVFPIHTISARPSGPSSWPIASVCLLAETTHLDSEAAVNVRMRPFSVIPRHDSGEWRGRGANRTGRRFAGWSLFVKDDRLIYEHNYVGLERYRVISTETIPEGSVKLGMEFKVTAFDISPT